MQHAFTVDVEDWYHGIPVSSETKRDAERRIDRSMDVLLGLLSEFKVKGTFFVLGPVAKEQPDLVRRLADEGHEIGCHGWSHELIYNMTPKTFLEDVTRSVDTLTEITGAEVVAFRAPYFSITNDSYWALEILTDLGFTADSSIFPVHNWRYGIPGFEPRPQIIETKSGSIMEFPLSIRKFFGQNLPISGGAYFRIYPYALTKSNFQHSEAQQKPVVYYLHPWELDPDHPRVKFNWKAQATHYFNLRSTLPKLRNLLRDFQFNSLKEIAKIELARKSP